MFTVVTPKPPNSTSVICLTTPEDILQHMCPITGRDADISYFRDGPLHKEDRLIRTRPEDLDLYRTWTLIAFLLDRPEVQAIYSDTALIKALHVHAQEIGHTPEDIARWFGPKVGSPYSGSKPRHTDHSTHFHLRSGRTTIVVTGNKNRLKNGSPETSHRKQHSPSEALSPGFAPAQDSVQPPSTSTTIISATCSSSTSAARAKQARERARLRAAQASRRRAQTGRVPFQDNQDATSQQRAQPKNEKNAARKDKRLSSDTRSRFAPHLEGSWFGFGNDA